MRPLPRPERNVQDCYRGFTKAEPADGSPWGQLRRLPTQAHRFLTDNPFRFSLRRLQA